MEVTGKIIRKLEPVSGTSKAGTQWSKQEYVLETIGDAYPKKVFFDFFGERAQQYSWIEVGQEITLSFDIESREYNGRWYTNIRGWKAERYVPTAQQGQAGEPPYQAAPAAPAPAPAAAPAGGADALPDFNRSSEDDELPF